tara:strand:- start:15297 stop:16706 length:1410 start_codon:yes stop_codon:yes gene_type:complete
MGINSLLDFEIDELTVGERTEFLWGLWRDQLEFALISGTPAIVQIMNDAGLNLGDFKDAEDLTKFPVVTKRKFRELGDGAFLPRKYQDALRDWQEGLEDYERLHVFPRFTGGTSVERLEDYTLIRWSNSDWLGAMQASTRGIKQQDREIVIPANTFVNYTFDHIAAPAFTGVVIYNGGTYVPRHLNLSDRDAFEMLKLKGCDGIISPPASNKLKGNGLLELLQGDNDLDDPYLTRENVSLVIVSSTPLTQEIYDLFAARGIPIKDGGGSTDIGAVMWNCTHDPLKFHTIDGNVLNEVVDRDGNPVDDGESGLFLSSRIAGVKEPDPFLTQLYKDVTAIVAGDYMHQGVARVSRIIGRDVRSLGHDELMAVAIGIEQEYQAASVIVPNQATQLLRYSGLMNETRYLAAEACGCGKTTPKFVGLNRTHDFDGKPEDLVRPRVVVAGVDRPDASGYELGLPDGCEVGDMRGK